MIRAFLSVRPVFIRTSQSMVVAPNEPRGDVLLAFCVLEFPFINPPVAVQVPVLLTQFEMFPSAKSSHCCAGGVVTVMYPVFVSPSEPQELEAVSDTV